MPKSIRDREKDVHDAFERALMLARSDGPQPFATFERALWTAPRIVKVGYQRSQVIRGERFVHVPDWSSICQPNGQTGFGSVAELACCGSKREVHNQIDRWLLPRIVGECGGNLSHAALELGISRKGLRDRLKRLGLCDAED